MCYKLLYYFILFFRLQWENLHNHQLIMAVFLVDLQFREKARNYLTSKEVLFVVLMLFLAMIPWLQIFNFMYVGMGGNATKFWQEFNEVHCNPKFAKMCPTP